MYSRYFFHSFNSVWWIFRVFFFLVIEADVREWRFSCFNLVGVNFKRGMENEIVRISIAVTVRKLFVERGTHLVVKMLYSNVKCWGNFSRTFNIKCIFSSFWSLVLRRCRQIIRYKISVFFFFFLICYTRIVNTVIDFAANNAAQLKIMAQIARKNWYESRGRILL